MDNNDIILKLHIKSFNGTYSYELAIGDKESDNNDVKIFNGIDDVENIEEYFRTMCDAFNKLKYYGVDKKVKFFVQVVEDYNILIENNPDVFIKNAFEDLKKYYAEFQKEKSEYFKILLDAFTEGFTPEDDSLDDILDKFIDNGFCRKRQ